MRRLIFLLLTACSSHSTGASPDAPSDGTADAPSNGTYQLACESHATTFPLLDKSCMSTSDCFIALHTVSCCGTEIAVGLSTSSQVTFNTVEAACDAGYPGCGCASGPTRAEDGRGEDQGAIQLECRAGSCTTYVP